MKYGVRLAVASIAILALSGCGASKEWGKYDDDSTGSSSTRLPRAPSSAEVSDYPQKIGNPYEVDGKTYTPEDVASYDEVGYASWYGQELVGNTTANGERFNPDGISGAHKTLPLPSYVEVTALDTGRTILVRVNDRGPFSNDRIIDLSQGAAEQLGIDQQGVAGVRVRKVNPNEQERVVLRAGGTATERIGTPDSLLSILRKNLSKLPRPSGAAQRSSAPLSPPPSRSSQVPPSTVAGATDGRFIIEGQGASSSAPTRPEASYTPTQSKSRSGGYVVQVAAFGDRNRANAMAGKIGAKVMSNGNGKIWRVRYGPYDSEKDAKAGLAQAKKRGYGNARILRADN